MVKNFLLMFGLLILACDENPSTSVADDSPVIINIKVLNNWNLADSAGLYGIEIKVKDEQGFDDLNPVAVEVQNDLGESIFSDSLYDNGGMNGTTDLIAGDGVFKNVFEVSVISSVAGQFNFIFSVSDKNGNRDSAAVVIIFAFNSAPSITNLSAPDSLLSTDPPYIISVSANDIDGDHQNILVTMDLLSDGLSILPEPYMLQNDGNLILNGDAFANDSIFSFKMDTSFSAGRTGNYTLKFIALDAFGDESSTITKEIYLENLRPAIFNLAAPETLVKPLDSQTLTTALITLNVSDPQSLADIDSVYFISIKPDSTPASGNPFVLLDNGIAFDINNFEVARGDELADDGIYSITILLDNNALSGVYQFTFFARDQVGNVSNEIQHLVEVQ